MEIIHQGLFVFRSIISLIANVSRSSEVMSEVFAVMRDAGVQVKNRRMKHTVGGDVQIIYSSGSHVFCTYLAPFRSTHDRRFCCVDCECFSYIYFVYTFLPVAPVA